MNMVGDLDRFMKFQAATAMEKSAENPGGSSGMDMGAGLAMGQMMMNQMNQSNNNSGGGDSSAQSSDDIMALLEKLGKLKESGILTDEEFNAKKKELLDRL